jgi:hypothetical protein
MISNSFYQNALVSSSASVTYVSSNINQEIPSTQRCAQRLYDFFCDKKDQRNQVFLSVPTIAKMIKYSANAVRRAIQILINYGKIFKQTIPGLISAYTIISPKIDTNLNKGTLPLDVRPLPTSGRVCANNEQDSFIYNSNNKKNTREAHNSQRANAHNPCPENFQPTDEQIKRAKQHNVDIQKSTREFILHNQAKPPEGVVNWHAWFEKWLDKAIDMKNKPKTGSNNKFKSHKNNDCYNPASKQEYITSPARLLNLNAEQDWRDALFSTPGRMNTSSISSVKSVGELLR